MCVCVRMVMRCVCVHLCGACAHLCVCVHLCVYVRVRECVHLFKFGLSVHLLVRVRVRVHDTARACGVASVCACVCASVWRACASVRCICVCERAACGVHLCVCVRVARVCVCANLRICLVCVHLFVRVHVGVHDTACANVRACSCASGLCVVSERYLCVVCGCASVWRVLCVCVWLCMRVALVPGRAWWCGSTGTAAGCSSSPPCLWHVVCA